MQANTIVPPPYSSTGSLDELASDKQCAKQPDSRALAHSASQLQEVSVDSGATSANSAQSIAETENPMPNHQLPSTQIVASVRDENSSNSNKAVVPNEESCNRTDRLVSSKNQTNCDGSPAHKNRKKLLKERSSDSESQEDNFSDLLNLSVCLPSNVVYLKTPIHSNPLLQELHYSVTTSMTGSDVSSLANLDTPESPPRATSPTAEMKELLNKIQSLPQQKTFALPGQEVRPSKNYFHKVRAKTLYMPLSGTTTNKTRNPPNGTALINFINLFIYKTIFSVFEEMAVAFGSEHPLCQLRSDIPSSQGHKHRWYNNGWQSFAGRTGRSGRRYPEGRMPVNLVTLKLN